MPKLLMNCDQVFDVLTRGPFPTGDDSDASVEHHLRACHKCRNLAEALQPAVELMHEAISRDEASGLPEYQGALVRLAPRMTATENAQLSVRRLARRRPNWVATYARFTAALVLLAALGSLTWGVFSTTKTPIARTSRAPARLDEAGLLTLASLPMPAGCFPRELLPIAGAAPLPAITQEALRCCTECHNAASGGRALLGSVATLQRSCAACHSL